MLRETLARDDLDRAKLAPVGRRAARRRDGRRLERFAELREYLPDRPGLGDEGDQPDVAASPGALEWKLLPHPRHQLTKVTPLALVG